MTMRRRRLAGWLRALLLSAIVLPAMAAWLALDGEPQVEARGTVTQEHVGRTPGLLRAEDPRWARAGGLHVVTLGERGLDLQFNHAAHRLLQARVDARGWSVARPRSRPARRWPRVCG